MFQSTPLREGRLVAVLDARGLNQFQSTPLREGRQGFFEGVVFFSYSFNPRPSVRSDFTPPPALPTALVSIHAPP